MQYRYVTTDDLVSVTLRGMVELDDWQSCFGEVEQVFLNGAYQALLIDAEDLTEFGLSNEACSDVAPGFAKFSARTAIFASSSLIFGMLRVMQGYSHNDDFTVHRTRDQAVADLAPFTASLCNVRSLP